MIMMKKEQFFTAYKATGIAEEAYAHVTPFLEQFMEAFANTTGNSLYIIDYYKKNFLYVSNNALFLCGLSPEEMKTLGFDFYINYVPESEHAMLLEINRAGFQFINTIQPDERCRYTISYDFHILPPGKSPLLINHQVTPIQLSPAGDVWLGLCVARLSSSSTFGHIEVTCSTSSDRWRLENGLWKPYPPIRLTENERAMLRMTVEGATIENIAERLRRSVHTVKFYRRSAFEKLGVSHIAEAIMVAMNKKLI